MKRKKIGFLAINVPYSSNYENIGKILNSKFDLDLIGNKEQDPRLKIIYKIKNYTSIKGKNLISWFIRDVINLWNYCKKEKPDIICSLQRPDFQGPLVALFGKLFKIKTVVRFSGSTFDYHKRRSGFMKLIVYFTHGWVMRLIFLANSIICMGKEQKKELIKHGCKSSKINIILQPTNQIVFRSVKNKNKIRKGLGLPLDKKILLYVGPLVDYKGTDSLLNLTKILKEKNKFYFVLIGEDRQNYDIKFRKINRNVMLTGRIPSCKIVKYYQAANLLIHPSYIEGFPKTVLEAAACGLPIIARDIVGIGRVADKTFKTDKELIDYVLNGKWKGSAKSKLPKEYRWKNLKEKYVKVFQELLQ